MSLIDLVWGMWDGWVSVIVLLAHVFGLLSNHPMYHMAISGNWYDIGFLLGVGSSIGGSTRVNLR